MPGLADLYIIYLPLQSNDGREIETEKLLEVRAELLERFRGITLLQGHVSNFLKNELTLWKNGRMEGWKRGLPIFHPSIHKECQEVSETCPLMGSRSNFFLIES